MFYCIYPITFFTIVEGCETTAIAIAKAMKQEGESVDKIMAYTKLSEDEIEVRVKTNLHVGNFPAIWLMPQPPADPNLECGEIDVLETFGTHNDTFHSVHTHRTANLEHTVPKNQFPQ